MTPFEPRIYLNLDIICKMRQAGVPIFVSSQLC